MKGIQEQFCWYEAEECETADRTPEEKYQQMVSWASRARGINPLAFDTLSAWLNGGGEWTDSEMADNQKQFQEEIVGRFLKQNQVLREELRALEPSGAVNAAVFDALDRFDDELSGHTHAGGLKEAVAKIFQDFSCLRSRETREKFAGSCTGPAGTDSVEVFGYINFLKDCDAAVQWTLFMPEVTRRQQDGFRVEKFEYVRRPALRFIGKEGDFPAGSDALKELVRTLDSLSGYRCGFDDDSILFHHFGRGVDVEPCHGVWGRFMAADAPVPDGFEAIDFIPQNDGKPGAPYLSQFAFAQFQGDREAMHRREDFDCDAMYDITRNIILGQNVAIPYPDKYWTAEVFPDGFGGDSTVYLFSVEK
ncbi:MAG: hypothetical protein HFJ80_08015 [Clostridiales bacterium]|nr:hypothetical protein [Clostridiales bacterium]